MRVNIIGFGMMGKQIAALFYLLGYEVNIFSRQDVSERIFLREIKKIEKRFKQKFDEKGCYKFYCELINLPNVPTIECVSEDLDVKKEIYSKVREENNCEYFTNTSSFSPDEIAIDVIGLHFFNPIVVGLVELANGLGKQTTVLDMMVENLSKLGFIVVQTKNNRGYIGNFVLFHEVSSAFKLVEKYGYTIESINQVYEKLYGSRDIFNIVDLVGVDVSLQILKNLQEIDSTVYVPVTLERAVQENIFGRKNKTSIKSLIYGVQ